MTSILTRTSCKRRRCVVHPIHYFVMPKILLYQKVVSPFDQFFPTKYVPAKQSGYVNLTCLQWKKSHRQCFQGRKYIRNWKMPWFENVGYTFCPWIPFVVHCSAGFLLKDIVISSRRPWRMRRRLRQLVPTTAPRASPVGEMAGRWRRRIGSST